MSFGRRVGVFGEELRVVEIDAMIWSLSSSFNINNSLSPVAMPRPLNETMEKVKYDEQENRESKVPCSKGLLFAWDLVISYLHQKHNDEP